MFYDISVVMQEEGCLVKDTLFFEDMTLDDCVFLILLFVVIQLCMILIFYAASKQ